jgi:hypothetical protein
MKNEPIINLADIDAALQSIAENSSDPVLEGRYRKAVASSTQRESVLRALAQNQDDRAEVWTTDAYRAAYAGSVRRLMEQAAELARR